MHVYPSQDWKKFHVPSIFTFVYKARVTNLNFVPQRIKIRAVELGCKKLVLLGLKNHKTSKAQFRFLRFSIFIV